MRRRLTTDEHREIGARLLTVYENFLGLHVALIKHQSVRHARPFERYLDKVRLDLDNIYFVEDRSHTLPSPYYGNTGRPCPKPQAAEAREFHRDAILRPLNEALAVLKGHTTAPTIDRFIKLLRHAELLGDFCADDGGMSKTFYSWLKEQSLRHDPVGALAHDYCGEPVCCPRNPQSVASIFRHLNRHHADRMDGVDGAVNLAWREFFLARALRPAR